MKNVIICKDNMSIMYLETFIKEFINKKGNKIIGIDFEFNRKDNMRVIALCQINFEIDNISKIFLFYPPDINIKLLDKLLSTNDIIKILHGGESLDIPYLFTEVVSNKELFCKNLFDTKYLCEYYNIKNNITDGKCKIYDLMKQMKVITNKQYNDMNKNDKMMGNIWEINIDVKNMNNMLIRYCVYDVLFLPQLYKSFIVNNPDTNYNIIQQISCYNYIYRFNGKLDEMFMEVSKYNHYRYNEMTFSEIYDIILIWLLSYDYIYNLYYINYFKKFIEIIIKNIIYNKIGNMKLYNFNNIEQFILFIKNISNNILN